MTLRLTTEIDARNILDHFNGFHDGFIKELSLRSHDSFSQEGPGITDIAHHLTGAFDAAVDVAHYNYGRGSQPYNRIVRCTFRNVGDFCFDLRDVKSHDWPIYEVVIQASQQPTEHDRTELCFSLVFSWTKLIGRQWFRRTEQVLTFKEAEFEER